MNTKLTLRLDPDLIREAKHFARVRKTSLSRVVGEYFHALAIRQREELATPPILTELSGILNHGRRNPGAAADYRRHLEEKYLR